MTETLIPLYQLGSLPRLAFALFFAGCSAICSCLPSPLFPLGHVLLISKNVNASYSNMLSLLF